MEEKKDNIVELHPIVQPKKEIIIVAPHPDDEVIGCYEILMNKESSPLIIYTEEVSQDRRQEAMKLKTFLGNIKGQFFANYVPENLLTPNTVLYFPDPVHEFHPDHRKIGARGEELYRRGLNVIFYSIQMNTHYIHEVKDSREKRRLLDKTYPSQKDLWKYEHKYFLWEGRYQILR